MFTIAQPGAAGFPTPVAQGFLPRNFLSAPYLFFPSERLTCDSPCAGVAARCQRLDGAAAGLPLYLMADGSQFAELADQ